MRNGDGDGLDPRLEQRLRDALDGVQPRFSSPRYLSARPRPAMWRIAPAVLVVALVSMLGLTVYSGSINPVVWTQRVVTVIHPNVVASPSPAQPAATTPSSQPSSTPEERASPEPSERPESSQSPEPRGSPDPRETPEPSSGGGESGGSPGD